MRRKGPLEFVRRPFFSALLIAILAALPLGRLSGADASCADLTALTIPQVRITKATDVAAGSFVAPGSTRALATPSFCRAEGVASPSSDSAIGFEIWMPPRTAW